MLPSIFGEDLFDDFFGDPFEMMVPQSRNPLYGKHAKNLMKTDVRETEDSYTHRPKQAFGFRTDNKTRPAAIAELVAFVRDHPELFHDRATLEEMLTFVRNEAGRPEAENGAHDDCIMALAIAHRIRGQQRKTRETPEAERVVWTEDMWEDWRHASPDERAYLESKWGKPRRR